MKKRNLLSLGLSAFLAVSAIPAPAVYAGEQYEKGDVNRDGYINAIDASLVLQAYSALSTGGDPVLDADAMALADMDGDGKVNAADASAILQKYAELSTSNTSNTVCLSENYKPSENAEKLEADEDFITAQTNLGIELLKRQPAGENVCISPCSVSDALAMTANGADGDTLEEMERVLGMDIDSFNGYSAGMRATLGDELKMADSVWFRKIEAHIEPEFLQKNADFYRAGIFTSPFDRTTVYDMNKWVRERTDGMIPKLIDGELNGSLVLLDTAVFEADWETPFADVSVMTAPFTASDGILWDAEMMCSEESYYLSGDNAKGIYKYYDGRKYAFAAIIPDEGISLADYLGGLSGGELCRILGDKAEYNVVTKLPKFSFDYSADLKDTLTDMGMISAFSYTADFSRMGGSDEGNFYIGSVAHKTHIDVNQQGTKAAAAAEIELPCTAYPVPPELRREVTFDRPFFYCIVDTQTNIPLFMGTVNGV